jgi:hypothetical protein
MVRELYLVMLIERSWYTIPSLFLLVSRAHTPVTLATSSCTIVAAKLLVLQLNGANKRSTPPLEYTQSHPHREAVLY